MILRNAVLSDQRRTIGRQQQREPAAHRAVVDAVPLLADPNPDADVVAGNVSEIDTVLPAPRERLSFEAVAAWLAVQDGETRHACASVLADELTHVHESARADGFEAGRLQGRNDAQQAAEQLHAVLRTVSESAEAVFAQEQVRLGELCVEIVAEAFAKIAGVLLPTREAAANAVVEVLQRVKEGRELTIRVSTADIGMLQQEERRLAAALPGRKFSLVADARVDIGGCIVESKLGSLDGRLEAQLRQLYETLRAAKAAPVDAP